MTFFWNILKQLGGLTLLNRTNAWHNMIITILISVRIGTYKLCCDEKDIRVMLKYNVPFFACFFSHCTFTLQFYTEMIFFRASNFIKLRWWLLVCYLQRVWKYFVAIFHYLTLIVFTNLPAYEVKLSAQMSIHEIRIDLGNDFDCKTGN